MKRFVVKVTHANGDSYISDTVELTDVGFDDYWETMYSNKDKTLFFKNGSITTFFQKDYVANCKIEIIMK